MKKRIVGLHIKIIVPILFLVMSSTLITAQLIKKEMGAAILKEFSSKGIAVAKSLATHAQGNLLNRDVSTIQGFIDEYKGIYGVAFVYVMDENRKIVVHTFSPSVPKELIQLEDKHSNNKIYESEMAWRGRKLLSISVPILAGALGSAHVGMDLDLVADQIMKIQKNILLISMLVIILSSLIIYLILDRPIRLVVELSHLAKKIESGDDVFLIESKLKTSDDEIGDLAQAFKKMIDEVSFQRRNLECMVSERTEKLQESLHALETTRSQLVQSSKLSALGEMAGGIAHEINNPLSVIKIYSSQLQEMMKDESPNLAAIAKASGKIENTVDRIAKIIQGLRSFSRDGAGDAYDPVQLSHLVEETLGFCSERFKNHKVALSVDPIDQSLSFEGREVQVSQVLLNLLVNALDAVIDSKGMEKPWVRLSIADEGDFINISITDSGKGISEEVRTKLFQPFFTTKPIGKGTGLGLSVSIGIIKSHRGELFIDTKSENTRFVMRLPKKQNQGVKTA